MRCGFLSIVQPFFCVLYVAEVPINRPITHFEKGTPWTLFDTPIAKRVQVALHGLVVIVEEFMELCDHWNDSYGCNCTTDPPNSAFPLRRWTVAITKVIRSITCKCIVCHPRKGCQVVQTRNNHKASSQCCVVLHSVTTGWQVLTERHFVFQLHLGKFFESVNNRCV